MADTHRALFNRHKTSSGNSHDDVFGGAPTLAVSSLSSVITDYGEIFGNFFGPRSTSIPVLAFPFDEVDGILEGRNTNFDYSEIFAALDTGDIPLHEDVISEKRRDVNPSTNFCTEDGAASMQQGPVASSKVSCGDILTASENQQRVSNDTIHDLCTSKPFSKLHDATHQTRTGDILHGSAHAAYLRVFSGGSLVADSCPSQDISFNDCSSQVSDNIVIDKDFNMEESNQAKSLVSRPKKPGIVNRSHETYVALQEEQMERGFTALADSSVRSHCNTLPSNNHLLRDQMINDRETDSNSMVPDKGVARKQHHLNVSGPQLSGSNDRLARDKQFLTVSDISLHTKPSQLPPPSRPPPALGSSNSTTHDQDKPCLLNHRKEGEADHWRVTSAFRPADVAAKDGPPFYDVEIDVNSDAAESAAAMREAMKKAQATLRNAKESMERRDSYHGHTMLGLNEHQHKKEMKRSGMPQENGFNETDSEGTRVDHCSKANGLSTNGNWKVMHPEQLSPNLDEWPGHRNLTKGYTDKCREEARGPFVTHKEEEGTDDLNVEEMLYKPTDDVESFKVDQQVIKQEVVKFNLNETCRVIKFDQIGKSPTKQHIAAEEFQYRESVQEVKLNNAKEAEGSHKHEEIKNIKASQESEEQQDKEKQVKIDQKILEWDCESKNMKETVSIIVLDQNIRRSIKEYFTADKDYKFESIQEEECNTLMLAEGSHKQEENRKNIKVSSEVEQQQEVEKKLIIDHRICEQREKHEAGHKFLENHLKSELFQDVSNCNESSVRLEVLQELEPDEKRVIETCAGEELQSRQKFTGKCDVGEELKLEAPCQVTDNEKKQSTRYCEEKEKSLEAAAKGGLEGEAETAYEHVVVERKVEVASVLNEEGHTLKAACEHGMKEKGLRPNRKRSEMKERILPHYSCRQDERSSVPELVLLHEEEAAGVIVADEVYEREETHKTFELVSESPDLKEGYVNVATVPENLVSVEILGKANGKQEDCNFEEQVNAIRTDRQLDESEKVHKMFTEFAHHTRNEKSLGVRVETCSGKLNNVQDTDGIVETEMNMKHDMNTCYMGESVNSGELIYGAKSYTCEKDVYKEMHLCVDNEMDFIETPDAGDQADKRQKITSNQVGYNIEENGRTLEQVDQVNEVMKWRHIDNIDVHDREANSSKEEAEKEVSQKADKGHRAEANKCYNISDREDNILKAHLPLTGDDCRVNEEKLGKGVHEGEAEKQEKGKWEREMEEVRIKKIEEAREREREREKDRMAVERSTKESCNRACAEARERAERVSVERVTSEAQQRAFGEVRERAEKTLFTERASAEAARLRAERAAVGRATAEARERAAEKALAESVASRDKADGRRRQSPYFSIAHDLSGTEGESAVRCKARTERYHRTVERAAKALAEKNLRDVLAQKEQAERNRLAESLDADVRRWSNGKEGNLRALLSTLQYILGAESGWQPIPLTDVITSVAVKKAYRKATLCVHPDKVQQRGACIQQKYICEKVFDLLKEAWNKFNAEER